MTKNDVSCSDQQLEDFIEKARMLQVQQYPTPNDFDGSTIFGIVRLTVLKFNLTSNVSSYASTIQSTTIAQFTALSTLKIVQQEVTYLNTV